MNPIFLQNERYSYRDPAAYYENGKVYLFFSLVENDGDNQILVVEDDKELNSAVCSFLIRNGYDAVGCLNASDAYDGKPCRYRQAL